MAHIKTLTRIKLPQLIEISLILREKEYVEENEEEEIEEKMEGEKDDGEIEEDEERR